MEKIAVFIHAALLSRWYERVSYYIDLMNKAGLLTHCKVYINLLGETSDTFYFNHNNISLLNDIKELDKYELPTLKLVYDFCRENPDYKVLYLHTKNVGKEINECIEDQIKYVMYFLISKWKDCIHELHTYNTASVDLRIEPVLHYSGNFWWANASYINTLVDPLEFNDLIKYPNPLNSLRHNQEFWLCYNSSIHIHKSVWDCGISVYERHLHRYLEDEYKRN